MIDFQLDKKGDLIFEEVSREESINLSYRVSSVNALELSFHLLAENDEIENNGLQIVFINDEKSDLKHKAKVISEIESKMQKILISLRTELSELRNRKSVGSELVKYRHGNIHDSYNNERIKDTVMAAISTILVNPKVVVKPTKGIGNFYSDNINIYIYEDDVRIFKFNI